jgi:hypothetical protein
MRKTLESSKPGTADEIAGLADSGKDISRFFTNTGKMMQPILPVSAKLVSHYMKYDITYK